jgi:hypothetical protein
MDSLALDQRFFFSSTNKLFGLGSGGSLNILFVVVAAAAAVLFLWNKGDAAIPQECRKRVDWSCVNDDWLL